MELETPAGCPLVSGVHVFDVCHVLGFNPAGIN